MNRIIIQVYLTIVIFILCRLVGGTSKILFRHLRLVLSEIVLSIRSWLSVNRSRGLINMELIQKRSSVVFP